MYGPVDRATWRIVHTGRILQHTDFSGVFTCSRETIVLRHTILFFFGLYLELAYILVLDTTWYGAPCTCDLLLAMTAERYHLQSSIYTFIGIIDHCSLNIMAGCYLYAVSYTCVPSYPSSISRRKLRTCTVQTRGNCTVC